MKLYVFLFAIVLLYTSPLKAHGDLDLRIERVTSLIETFPDSASLYFKRGKLRFQHEEYNEAISDIHKSIDKGFIHELQNIYLAKSFFKLKDFHTSMIKLDEFLKNDPNNVVALNLQARLYFAQEKYKASALGFERVIKLTIRSLPENYLEAADAWLASSHIDKYENAVNILESGIDNLGHIVTLQNKLIKIHLENQDGDKALKVQQTIIEKTRRKESAYFKLAEIYIELDKIEEAKSAAENALIHFKKLPRRIQRNSAMKKLENKIQLLITKY